jgi:mannose-1-phosphate guanylyltransferase
MRYAGEWKDVGSWNTFSEAMSESVIGAGVLDEACENTNVVNELNLPILCMNCKNLIVAASVDGILISEKNQSAKIKPYVEKLDQEARFAEKSWGNYTVLDVQDDSMTIKVELRAGQQMSYHSHEHRDEIWTVISGSGKAIVDGAEKEIRTGDVVTMAVGCKHRVIANEDGLQIIEVQLGREISAQDKQKYKQ